MKIPLRVLVKKACVDEKTNSSSFSYPPLSWPLQLSLFAEVTAESIFLKGGSWQGMSTNGTSCIRMEKRKNREKRKENVLSYILARLPTFDPVTHPSPPPPPRLFSSLAISLNSSSLLLPPPPSSWPAPPISRIDAVPRSSGLSSHR